MHIFNDLIKRSLDESDEVYWAWTICQMLLQATHLLIVSYCIYHCGIIICFLQVKNSKIETNVRFYFALCIVAIVGYNVIRRASMWLIRFMVLNATEFQRTRTSSTISNTCKERREECDQWLDVVLTFYRVRPGLWWYGS